MHTENFSFSTEIRYHLFRVKICPSILLCDQEQHFVRYKFWSRSLTRCGLMQKVVQYLYLFTMDAFVPITQATLDSRYKYYFHITKPTFI